MVSGISGKAASGTFRSGSPSGRATLQSLADILLTQKLDDGSKADKRLPGNHARHGRFVKESNRENKHLFVAQRIKAGDGSQR
jgi:hypothetical protein